MRMSLRQRSADMSMAYLGKAWRIGFWGPRENPTGCLSEGQAPPDMDSERILTIHATWLRVAAEDEYLAAVLKLHYRDGYDFPEKEILEALDLFAKLW